MKTKQTEKQYAVVQSAGTNHEVVIERHVTRKDAYQAAKKLNETDHERTHDVMKSKADGSLTTEFYK